MSALALLCLAWLLPALTSPVPSFTSLSSFTSASARLPCKESGAYESDSRITSSSIFPADGAAFTGLVSAYLASAAPLVSDPTRWPLDSSSHASALAAAAYSASPGAPLAALPHVARVDFAPGTELHVFGDLHGAYHSLLRTLHHLASTGALNASSLQLQPPHAAAFLGDYVDRGTNGVETLALLLALKTANPTRVFMARGNHEDVGMNSGSFEVELARKFPDPRAAAAGGVLPSVLHAIQRVYESLPRALLLGTHDATPGWCHHATTGAEAACPPGSEGIKQPHAGAPPPPRHLLAVHGGLEVGFDASPLLHYYRVPDSAAAAAASASSSPQVYFALMHGYARTQWLEGLQPALRAHPVMPLAIQQEVKEGLFRDWGIGLGSSSSSSSTGLQVAGAAADADADAVAATTPQAALQAARAARSAAAAQWGQPGAEWPLDIHATHPADGFMWADFIVAGHRRIAPNVSEGLVHSRGRGLAYGLALTDDYLARSSLVGVLRAHQHNNAASTGPMLERVLGGRGSFVNWGTPANGGSGHVTTFLSGAFIPGLGFEMDAHGVLRLPDPHPATWHLTQCSQRVQAGSCSMASGAVQCTPVLWRAVERGAEAGVALLESGAEAGREQGGWGGGGGQQQEADDAQLPVGWAGAGEPVDEEMDL